MRSRGRVASSQGRPYLESESPEVLPQASWMSVASIEVPSFPEAVSDDRFDSGTGRSSPRCEPITGKVVEIAGKALEFGGEAQNEGLV